jgi:acyl carrier protein
VATPTAQLGRSDARERVLDAIRTLLEELGSQGAVTILSPGSQLDRDLGLGSLERVELIARLEKEFGVRLPDRIVAEANTPEDLAAAIFGAPLTPSEEEEPSALRAAITTQRLHAEAEDKNIPSAETLLDVLRYRAANDPTAAAVALR